MEPEHITIHELLKNMNQDHIIEAYEKASPENQKALA